jgi:hypothetical protein
VIRPPPRIGSSNATPSSIARTGVIGEPDRSRTRAIPSTSSAAALPDAGLCASRGLADAFFARQCLVRTRSTRRPSRPGRPEWSSLDYLLGSTALMGFQIFVYPSQVCSHRRAAAASLQQPGPRVRCRRSFIRTRLIFVGLQSARARPGVNGERKRARLADRRMSASMDFWACVFPVCGPFPRRRVRSLMSHAFSERLGSFLPWAFPLSGLSGTLMCIARGSNRARSSASAKPARALSRAPHGVGFFAHAAIE